MRRYSADNSITSSGELIHSKSCLEKTAPKPARKIPLTMLIRIAVCTVLDRASSSFAPKYFAASTFAPTDKPTNRLTIRLMSAEVDPTAASELSPAKCPTTTISAALNNSCRMLEHISGSANSRSFPRSGPFIISISCFFISLIPSFNIE